MTDKEIEELKKKAREVNKEEIEQYEKNNKKVEWLHGGAELLTHLRNTAFDRLRDVGDYAVCIIRAASYLDCPRIFLITSICMELLVSVGLPFHNWHDIYASVFNPAEWALNVSQNTTVPPNCYFIDYHMPHSANPHVPEEELLIARGPKTYIAATGVAPSVSGVYFHSPNS